MGLALGDCAPMFGHRCPTQVSVRSPEWPTCLASKAQSTGLVPHEGIAGGMLCEGTPIVGLFTRTTTPPWEDWRGLGLYSTGKSASQLSFALCSVRTPGPATRTPLPFCHIATNTFNVRTACFGFLYRRCPTNPFITRKWRKTIPGCSNNRR